MNISQLVLVVAIFNLILGFYTWKTNPRKPLNISFGLFAFTIGIWVFLNFLFQRNPQPYFLKFIYAIGPFIIINGFLWISYFSTDKVSRFLKRILFFLYSSSTIFAILMFVDNLMISSVASSLDYQTGPWFPIYSIYMGFVFLTFITYLVYQYIKANNQDRLQFRLIFIGMAITVIITGIVSYILPTLFNDTRWNILDSPSSIVFVLFATFSILRYQLLNIKAIVSEIIIYFLLVLVFIILFITKSDTLLILRLLFMLFMIYGSYILVNSVKKEIEQKEQLQVLSDQLANANVHLKDLDKMKTEFVSLASHELLTPVSAIEGYLSMMLDEHLVKLEDPKAVQYMDRVYRSAKRLARLISDMLNISRIEEGRLLVEKKNVDLNELIRQVLEELKFKADEHKQTIVFANGLQPTANSFNGNNSTQPSAGSRQPEAKLMTFADPDKIKEVLVNLIGNSIKYTMNPGTITVSVEKVPTAQVNETWGKLEAVILASTVDDQESIHAVADDHKKKILGAEQYLVRVKDQGIGIPPEELPKLFKKFHRVGDFSTAESQGTGLGLYITRALVELHHGRVWPDSEGQGKGSTFTFSLPTLAAKQEIINLETQSPETKEQLKPLAKPMGNDDAL